MKKNNLTLMASIIAALAVIIGLYFGFGSQQKDLPPSLPSIGGSQFAGSTQVIQVNNSNGLHSSLIKPACNGRYSKALELSTSPLYVNAFGVDRAVTVSEFLSKVSPDNQHYVMLMFNQATQSYMELGSNMFGGIPRVNLEEFDTYKIASNQMVYIFTNKSNKFCFESSKQNFRPIEDLNGWALVQLYNTQLLSNVRSAYQFDDEAKPVKFTETIYTPGFYWFAFDYSDFSENFNADAVAVSAFGNFSDKSIYLRNSQNEEISLGVYEVLSKESVDRILFEVKSQSLDEFLSITTGLRLKIGDDIFDIALPETLSEESLFAVELSQEMQTALSDKEQIEVFAVLKATDETETLDLALVFESGENKSESVDLPNLTVYLSDLSLALADSSADLSLYNGLQIDNLDYANVDFAAAGDVDVEYIKIRLLDNLEVDSLNNVSIDFVIDSQVVASHRFTNDESEFTLPTSVVDSLLTADGETLLISLAVDLFAEQSDLDFVLETKLAIAQESLLVELPALSFADAKQIIGSDYFTYADSCMVDSNIYYDTNTMVNLLSEFKSVYGEFYEDADSVDSVNIGLEITPYVEFEDFNYNVQLFGTDPVDVQKDDGVTNLFTLENDFSGVLINFKSDSYTEAFTEEFNSKRMLSLDTLQVSSDNMKLRFNLSSSDTELAKVEHRCQYKNGYALNVDDLILDSKILVSDLSEFVKLNFTNLVLGKNIFVKIDWEESLLALLDLDTNPLITEFTPDFGFGFNYTDSDELGSILDQLLDDLGEDTSLTEQELEDLIESNPISVTVGNANANLITEDFDLVYEGEIYRVCTDEISNFNTNAFSVVDVDEYLNYFYRIENGNCVLKQIQNDINDNVSKFEVFNGVFKKNVDLDELSVDFLMFHEPFDLDADNTPDSFSDQSAELSLTFTYNDNQLVQECVISLAENVTGLLDFESDCFLNDNLNFEVIKDAYNLLDVDEEFELKLELDTTVESFSTQISLLELPEILKVVKEPIYFVFDDVGECTINFEENFFGYNKLHGSVIRFEFDQEVTAKLFNADDTEINTFDEAENFIEYTVNTEDDYKIEFDEDLEILKLSGVVIDDQEQDLLQSTLITDSELTMFYKSDDIQLCNVTAE